MELLFFLMGYLTCQYILPILDSFLSLLYQVIESWKGEAVLKTTKYKAQSKKLLEDSKPILGFTDSPELTEEDDE